eukprot:362600-Amphidinium_carterae.3
MSGRSMLVEWVGSAASVTRHDAIAVLKVLNEVTETATPEQLHVGKGIVMAFCRLGVWTTHPDLKALMSQKLDSIITEAKSNFEPHLRPVQ